MSAFLASIGYDRWILHVLLVLARPVVLPVSSLWSLDSALSFPVAGYHVQVVLGQPVRVLAYRVVAR